MGRNIKRPYDPNFSITLANTIEPPTGASTCAFGNQVWNRYMGVFTINLKVIAREIRCELVNEICPVYKINNSNGKLETTVYNKSKREATSFSGW